MTFLRKPRKTRKNTFFRVFVFFVFFTVFSCFFMFLQINFSFFFLFDQMMYKYKEKKNLSKKEMKKKLVMKIGTLDWQITKKNKKIFFSQTLYTIYTVYKQKKQKKKLNKTQCIQDVNLVYTNIYTLINSSFGTPTGYDFFDIFYKFYRKLFKNMKPSSRDAYGIKKK